MKTCFVIQPFDDDKYDKRYKDEFEPAITAAGFKPYRVDDDPSVRIPIETIEEKIKESSLCFAEISTNNPNVWYELGFAFACGKDVIMVCSDEKRENFPFDIQSRSVIKYKTASSSDFTKLRDSITEKITAFQKKVSANKNASSAPTDNVTPVQTQGIKSLNRHEMGILVFLFENHFTAEGVIIDVLNKEESGLKNNVLQTNLAIKQLENYEIVEIFSEYHLPSDGNVTKCRITKKGEVWILENQDALNIHKGVSLLF